MIFPFINGNHKAENRMTHKEYAWDFQTNDFLLKDGKPYIVEGIEALKIWILKILKTERYKYLAYSWTYGSEISTVIGNKFKKREIEIDLKNIVEDVLLRHPQILSVNNLIVSQSGKSLSVQMTIHTEYGEVDVNV